VGKPKGQTNPSEPKASKIETLLAQNKQASVGFGPRILVLEKTATDQANEAHLATPVNTQGNPFSVARSKKEGYQAIEVSLPPDEEQIKQETSIEVTFDTDEDATAANKVSQSPNQPSTEIKQGPRRARKALSSIHLVAKERPNNPPQVPVVSKPRGKVASATKISQSSSEGNLNNELLLTKENKTQDTLSRQNYGASEDPRHLILQTPPKYTGSQGYDPQMEIWDSDSSEEETLFSYNVGYPTNDMEKSWSEPSGPDRRLNKVAIQFKEESETLKEKSLRPSKVASGTDLSEPQRSPKKVIPPLLPMGDLFVGINRGDPVWPSSNVDSPRPKTAIPSQPQHSRPKKVKFNHSI